jgi:hypothetical protein
VNYRHGIIIVFLCIFSSHTCLHRGVQERDEEVGTRYNFKLLAYDENIKNPQSDRRSFYKVYIDKIETGRTTIGLESQIKSFETRLSSNRHLLIVEKWVLVEKKKKYVKLNNIDQPKPHFLYFTLPRESTVVITMRNDVESRKASFHIEYR